MLNLFSGQMVAFDPAPEPKAGSDKPPSFADFAGHQIENNVEDDDEIVAPDASDCVFMVYRQEKVVEPPVEFRPRPAFVELQQQGLTDLPPGGKCALYYHRSTSQWHGVFGAEGERNRAPTWSPSLRSEQKALLLCLIAIWTWFCGTNNDACHRKYLAVLQQKPDQTPF